MLAPLGFSGGGNRLRKEQWVLEILPGSSPELFAVGVGRGARTWKECPQQTTLGHLWKNQAHHWSIAGPDDIKPVVEEITVLILEKALPWLMRT
ncbi:MAG: hypothetical protein U0931_09135 [Vulcanimicrobiota bacterium]